MFPVEHVFILIISVVHCLLGQPPPSRETGAHVVGSLLTFCGSPVLYSSVSPSVPVASARNSRQVTEPEWQTDWSTECLGNHTELVNYCRQRFAASGADVTGAVLAPVRVVLHLPTTENKDRTTVLKFQPYWCLTGSSIGENQTVHRLQSPTNHLPTLLDVHRAFFNERFRQLSTRMEERVGDLVQQLVHSVEHLASLRDISPQQTRHLTSDLLQSAHGQLKAVWSANEAWWSNLEHERHADVSAQLESEDVAGEQEFAYVLQEPGASIDRLQTALSRLLAGITASVKEEVEHLTKVLERQPATLQLKSNSTTAKEHWSTRVTRYVTSLDKVHAVLLRLVQQATVAINILRTRMHNDSSANLTSHHRHFQPALVANYNNLQAELKEARRYLLLAKQRVLTELARQSQSLARQLRPTKTAHLIDKSLPSADTPVDLSDPWGVLTKHRDDLAYIDFMAYHVLTNFPKNRSYGSTFGASQLRTWNEIWRPNQAPIVKLTPEQLTRYRTSFVYAFATAFKTVATAFCVGVALLLVVCFVVYLTGRRRLRREAHPGRDPPGHDQLMATWRHNTKHWLAGTWMGPSRKAGSARTGQGRPGSAGVDTKPLAPSVHGYSNPVC